MVLPNPVRTTEQYCSLLLTISSSRFSMYSLDTSPQGRGIVLRVSNLYPGVCQFGTRVTQKVRCTPKLHLLLRYAIHWSALLGFLATLLFLEGLMFFDEAFVLLESGNTAKRTMSPSSPSLDLHAVLGIQLAGHV